MGGDVTVTHAKTVKAYYLVGEVVGQNGLSLLYKFRFKAALPVLGRIDVEGAVAALDRLLALAVAFVALGPLNFVQMPLHLRLKGLFDHVLQHWGESTSFTEKVLAGHELVKHLLFEFCLFFFSHDSV